MSEQRERLSGLDAAWLHMESPESPMVITGLLRFSGPVDWGVLRGLVEERLVGRYPRFSQRISRSAMGAPHWVIDDDFAVEDHLVPEPLPAPGGEEGLQRLVGRIMGEALPERRPLWRVHLVDGPGPGAAMVARIHHAIGDGFSLARVLLSLADGGGDPVPAVQAGAPLTDGPASEPFLAAARRTMEGAEEVAHLLALPADPPTTLKGELSGTKTACWAPPVPLERIKEVGRRYDATVNDVMLAALSASLGHWLRDQGNDVDAVRAFVPVNLRPLDAPVPATLGNDFTLVLVPLPVGRRDPADHLDGVKTHMDSLKRGQQAGAVRALLRAMGATPAKVEQLAVDFFGSKGSLVVTNVPGPGAPISLAGIPVDGIQFWVPQSGQLGLGVSIFSYAGSVSVGVAADARRIPEPERIALGFAEALDALSAEAPPATSPRRAGGDHPPEEP